MTDINIDTPEEKSTTFQCICQGRNHILTGTHLSWHTSEGIEDEEISLGFKCLLSDQKAEDVLSSDFINILRRLRWRMSRAISILFRGYFEIEDHWVPIAYKGDELSGETELKTLLTWLQNALELAQNNVKAWKKDNANNA